MVAMSKFGVSFSKNSHAAFSANVLLAEIPRSASHPWHPHMDIFLCNVPRYPLDWFSSACS